MTPQSKRKHQRGGARDQGLDAQRRGATTPRRSPDAIRESKHSPSQTAHERHSRGARKEHA